MSGRTAKILSFLTPKRRWLQTSLGSMLLMVTMLCVWLADYVSPVRRLERQLSDPDEEVRERAAERLGYMGSDARSATNSLFASAKDDTSSSVRKRAVWALSRVSRRGGLLEPLLVDNDEEVSLAAAEGMLWIGDDPAKVASVLLARGWYQEVGSILEGMAPSQAATMIPLLLDALWSEEKAKQADHVDPAAEAIKHAFLPRDTIVPALTARLNHEEPQIRTAAAEQLLRLRGKAKESVPALRSRLNDSDKACAAACAAALCAIDPGDTTALQILKAALHSDDIQLVYHAEFYVSALGSDAGIVVDDLIASVCDSRAFGGWPSPFAGAIVRLGSPAVDALDRALRNALSERDQIPATLDALRERVANIAWVTLPEVRRVLENARGTPAAQEDEHDTPNDQLLPSDSSATVRSLMWLESWSAARASPNRHSMIPFYLGLFGPVARPAVPTLIRALDYPDFRSYSIHALGNIGPDAAPAIPKLLAIVRANNASSSLEAFLALHNIAATDDWSDEDFQQATAKIVALLDSGDEPSRFHVFGVLEKTGVRGEWARAKLRPFLKNEDRHLRVRAALALAASHEPVEQILPTLIELAIDPHFRRNHEGLPPGDSFSPDMEEDLLASIASLGTAAVPGLMASLQDGKPLVRRVAADAIGKIGPSASEAVPRLIELLDDEYMWDAAAEALGRVGPASRPAVPKLLKALVEMREPPDPSDYDPNEYDPDEWDWSGYDPYEYYPRLNALAGIGQEARSAVPEVVRIANFDDRLVRQAAVLALARIDPTNSSLMPRMRRLLAEWERKLATEELHETWLQGDPVEKLAEAIRDLGQHAEPLAPDLENIVTADHLINWEVRCYAAFALAGFPKHQKTAVKHLESVVAAGFPNSFESMHLANSLLQRIKGVPKSETRPVTVLWGGP